MGRARAECADPLCYSGIPEGARKSSHTSDSVTPCTRKRGGGSFLACKACTAHPRIPQSPALLEKKPSVFACPHARAPLCRISYLFCAPPLASLWPPLASPWPPFGLPWPLLGLSLASRGVSLASLWPPLDSPEPPKTLYLTREK